MITYKGKEYPTRTFTMESRETGEITVEIADETLQLAIQKNNGQLKGATERSIDESIYFFVEEGILSLPADVICYNHLDEKFVFISEEI